MPRKTHRLKCISVKDETYIEIVKHARDNGLFDYEVLEEAWKKFKKK